MWVKYFVLCLCSFVMLGVSATYASPQQLRQFPETSQSSTNEQIQEPGFIEGIPTAYITESQMFEAYCDKEKNMRQYYNCECLAAEFLQTRLEEGPDVPRKNIMNMVSRTCHDAKEAAGLQYSDCLGSQSLLPKNINPDTYCRCYANSYAKFFEDNKLTLSPRTMGRAQTEASVMCRKPGYAEENYGS